MIHEYILPTRLIHGSGSAAGIGAEVKAFGCRSALVVTDRGLEKAGVVNGILESLSVAGVEFQVFADVPEDPRVDTIDNYVAAWAERKYECIVGVGGGSPLCAAKAVAMLATNGGSVRDYFGIGKVRERPLPMIAIPTTAGSGTEVSRAFVVYDPDMKAMMSIISPYNFPPVAILDPLLLQSLPFRQAALSGVDALTHAIEAYFTDMTTAITDAMALSAIRLLATSLARSAGTGDVEAKHMNLLGSVMANMACGNARLGLVHGLNEPIGGWFRLQHGLGNGVLLPRVMEFNFPVAVPRFVDVALALGESRGNRGDRELAEAAIRGIKRLLADLDFPRCFTDPPVERQSLPKLASIAAHGMYEPAGPDVAELPPHTLIVSANIRQVTVRDAIAIYEKCFEPWKVD